jgi:hypothetical protein
MRASTGATILMLVAASLASVSAFAPAQLHRRSGAAIPERTHLLHRRKAPRMALDEGWSAIEPASSLLSNLPAELVAFSSVSTFGEYE